MHHVNRFQKEGPDFMFRLVLRVCFALTLVCGLLAPVLHAQSVTARFSGTVTDTDGGAIPGAAVQVVNQESFAKREVKSDASGTYAVASLPAGRYQVIVEANGFSRRLSDIITLVA